MKQTIDNPVWSEWTGDTATICLRTAGCRYARSTTYGGCLHCELLQHSDKNVTIENIVNQVLSGLATLPPHSISRLHLLTLGSFLDDHEVPLDAKVQIGNILTQTSITDIMIESRPEYITKERLRELKDIFGLNTEIAVGIETVNDDIRQNYLWKGYDLFDVEMAAKQLAKEDMAFAGYVLLKPPIYNEQQAIRDAVQTSRYIFSLKEKYGASSRVLLQPYYTPISNRIKDSHLQKYRPPYLWSVIDVLKQIHDLGPVYVGMNNERLSNDSARNCPECTDTVLGFIRQFNSSRDVGIFENISCTCIAQWQTETQRSTNQEYIPMLVTN